MKTTRTTAWTLLGQLKGQVQVKHQNNLNTMGCNLIVISCIQILISSKMLRLKLFDTFNFVAHSWCVVVCTISCVPASQYYYSTALINGVTPLTQEVVLGEIYHELSTSGQTQNMAPEQTRCKIFF